MKKITTKLTPCLWFDNQAEEAANFYTSVFKNSKVLNLARYGDAGTEASGQNKGTVMTVSFELDGQQFLALNGGSVFKFNEAVSFIVNCENQDEVDYFWQKLTSAGGQESRCGWLKDKYGLSWQIVPSALNEMMADKDRKKAERVMAALMKMKKIDLNVLKQAYENAPKQATTH